MFVRTYARFRGGPDGNPATRNVRCGSLERCIGSQGKNWYRLGIVRTCDGGCSSVGRALDCDSSGRGFKPRQPPQFLLSFNELPPAFATLSAGRSAEPGCAAGAPASASRKTATDIKPCAATVGLSPCPAPAVSSLWCLAGVRFQPAGSRLQPRDCRRCCRATAATRQAPGFTADCCLSYVFNLLIL